MRTERISDNLPVMQSDEFADIIEVMEKFQDNFRWLDTESFELRNKPLRFFIIIRIVVGKLLFLRKGYVAVCKTGF